jgi:hypothetical protein
MLYPIIVGLFLIMAGFCLRVVNDCFFNSS